MTALSLVLLNFWSAIELPIINCDTPLIIKILRSKGVAMHADGVHKQRLNFAIDNDSQLFLDAQEA